MTTSLGPLPQEPVPAPPDRGATPVEWARANLFSSWWNGAITLVAAPLIVWAVYEVAWFVFVDARWEIIERNLTNVLVFRFPRDELWRLWAALFVLAATFGYASGALAQARDLLADAGRTARGPRGLALRRAGPVLLLVGVFLLLARSLTATLLVLAVAAAGVVLHLAGRRLPVRSKWAWLVGVGGIVAAFLVVTVNGVGWSSWGGLLLTFFLAVAGILLSFPLGVLLALGRRSSLPAVRWTCIAYIELIRGVPLITLLFMGLFVIGFFLPPGMDRPSIVTRALIAIVLFTAAYVAEIVRGGLQSVPQGQIEAAHALGLSAYRTTRQIVLPQALRAVIPALVGQFISLFKDTSLVAIIGLTELLGVTRSITAQRDFIAQGLIVETLLFAAFVYWVGSYWMSRESQRLEARLGVGTR